MAPYALVRIEEKQEKSEFKGNLKAGRPIYTTKLNRSSLQSMVFSTTSWEWKPKFTGAGVEFPILGADILPAF